MNQAYVSGLDGNPVVNSVDAKKKKVLNLKFLDATIQVVPQGGKWHQKWLVRVVGSGLFGLAIGLLANVATYHYTQYHSFAAGREEGLEEGREVGRRESIDVTSRTFQDLLTSTVEVEISKRYGQAIADSREEGYRLGFSEGKIAGHKEGYDQGIRVGDAEGFNRGLDEGARRQYMSQFWGEYRKTVEFAAVSIREGASNEMLVSQVSAIVQKSQDGRAAAAEMANALNGSIDALARALEARNFPEMRRLVNSLTLQMEGKELMWQRAIQILRQQVS